MKPARAMATRAMAITVLRGEAGSGRSARRWSVLGNPARTTGIATAHHMAILVAVSPRPKNTPSQASVGHGTFSPRRARYPATRAPETRKLPPGYVPDPGPRH